VVFKNASTAPHSVEWDPVPGAPPNVPVFNAGASSSPVSMSNTGTFNYHCGVHGPQMNGTINVT
jgi:plastocyanin